MNTLRLGILVPILYFGNVFGSALLYPGYSHGRQYASELGAAGARYPQLFNTLVILTGVVLLVSLIGFRGALRRLSANAALSWAFLASLAGFGVGALMGGLFPMPDPRHNGFGLGFALHAAPLLLAAALWRVPGTRKLRLFLLVSFAAGVLMLAILMGAGQLVTRANIGAFQRLYALANIPWIGVAAWVLHAAPSTPESRSAASPSCP
jgi:hypothetical membrane protein